MQEALMARKKSTPAKPAVPAPPAADVIPVGYAQALEQLKARIRTAQLQASLAVNRELIQLYWDLGKQIVERQKIESWGKGVVDRLARDLQKEFQGMTGFSPS